MAQKTRHLTIKQNDINRLEGLRQELADKEMSDRPKSEAIELVAQCLGIQRRTLREWVRVQRPASRNNDTVERFLEVYDKIVYLQCESLKSELFKMAKAGERDGYRALMTLLARMDPEGYDPNYQEPEDAGEPIFNSADVPQEVYDELTEEEHAMIEDMRAQTIEIEERYKQLILTAEHRVRARELGERSTRSN